MGQASRDARLKPMPLWLSLILFGVPGIFFYWAMYSGIPLLLRGGLPLIISFALLSLPGIGLLIVSLAAYRLDGYGWNWTEFKERFRFHRISGKAWWLILGIFVIATLCDEGLQGIGKWLAAMPLFSPPDYLPAPFNPLREVQIPLTEFLGESMKGNWGVLALWLPLNFFSMLGEEFMWRGYILPRQQLAYGRWAWVVNGLLWAFLMHLCMKWHYIGMLPSMLLTPWLAQRLQNTTASAVVHIAGNAILFWALLLSGVLA